MQLTLDPSFLGYAKPRHFDVINETINHLVLIQKNEGYWGKENILTFDKIYYTTQVVQCLLNIGFPLDDETVQKALTYLQKFKDPIIENRARFFLFLPLGMISEEELRAYLKMLKSVQRGDGSFYFQKPTDYDANGFRTYRRGSPIFNTLHTAFFDDD